MSVADGVDLGLGILHAAQDRVPSLDIKQPKTCSYREAHRRKLTEAGKEPPSPEAPHRLL